jgi:peptide/nickel transport system substrate-binding protein
MVTKRTHRPKLETSAVASAIAVVIALSACTGSETPREGFEPVTLRIGFGLAAGGTADVGIGAAARNIAFDELVSVPPSGRTVPLLAEGFSVSDDGLTVHVKLRPAITFADGRLVDAEAVSEVLRADLPDVLGPAFEDVVEIRPASPLDVEVRLRKRSSLLLEALDFVYIVDPHSRESGTGPFSVQSRRDGQVEMVANAGYFGGRPSIDRVVLKPYESVRSAWADMLRGQVDMLYEVGVDALDSLESSNEVNIFSFPRSYAYLLLLNERTPVLRDPAFRRRLNAAIDRHALIEDALRGHGTPADGPVSPRHWARAADLPRFEYQSTAASGDRRPRQFTVLFSERSLERLAVAIQRQLQTAGIEITLEPVSADEMTARLRAGKFDAVLSDYFQGPNFVWPYLYWSSKGPYNFGHYQDTAVDDALERIRRAPDDPAYKAGVDAFWRAIVNDPPAVFLAWSERMQAVSTRFVVPIEPDKDVLTSLHLWKPASHRDTHDRH